VAQEYCVPGVDRIIAREKGHRVISRGSNRRASLRLEPRREWQTQPRGHLSADRARVGTEMHPPYSILHTRARDIERNNNVLNATLQVS
jgi:hypothetical protein